MDCLISKTLTEEQKESIEKIKNDFNSAKKLNDNELTNFLKSISSKYKKEDIDLFIHLSITGQIDLED